MPSIARVLLAGVLSACVAAPVWAQGIRKGKTASGIAYDVQGSGPVVVLLTGSNLDRRMWTREAEWLAKTYMVVRYDLRAHGESDTATTPFSHLADLTSVLDELKIQKATLIGLSAGSTIALEAALEMPARVERMVLAGPAIGGFAGKVRPSFPPEMTDAIQAREWRKVSEALLTTVVFEASPETRALVRQMVTENERLWTVDRKLMKPPINAAERLASIRVPTLVVVGERDMSQIEHAELLAARIPGAQLVRIPGGAHIVNLTSPKEFDAAVRAFLASR
jgi:pimeloyl-ACP methyl ester carboxylesterase